MQQKLPIIPVMQQHQQAMQQQLQHIEVGMIRSTNSAISFNSHTILPLPNHDGVFPTENNGWFPTTKFDLDTASGINLTRLINFYNLGAIIDDASEQNLSCDEYTNKSPMIKFGDSGSLVIYPKLNILNSFH